MSGHQFTFPPPPPAPPKASPSYSGVSQSFAGTNGFKGRRGSKDHGIRGRGRGLDRGSERSGHLRSTQSNSGYGKPSIGIDHRHSSLPDMGYNVQKPGYRRSGYPLPHYPPVQLPQFPTNVSRGYGPQNQAFPPNARPPQAAYPANEHGSYQNYNGQHQYAAQGYSPSLPTMEASLPAAQNNSSFQTNTHVGQPVLMGPPIRMGFDARRNGSSQTQQHAPPMANATRAYQYALSGGNESPYRLNSSMGFRSGGYESLNAFPENRGRGQKRGPGETYNRPRNQNQRTQVAPAVPSFGSQLPLPLKPPALHGNTRKPRKKKRKYNQLGLTPKAEEHESSEEEEDTDEEARLAAVAASAGQGHQLLQFHYKGRTSILQSFSDITAWIEERKKRYPTKARAADIAEVRRQCNTQQRAADQLPRAGQEKHRSAVRKSDRQRTEGNKQQKKAGIASEDAAGKSKRKVEKLRKQLEKEERRIAKAEANASKVKVERNTEAGQADVPALGNGKKKRKRSVSGGSGNATIEDTNLMKPEFHEAASTVPDPLTPTSEPAGAEEERYPLPKALNAGGRVISSTGQEEAEASFPDSSRSVHDSSISASDSSSNSSSMDSEDDTSSSGSSSNGDSDDGAPDETLTKRGVPERVAPPKRVKPKQMCRAFLHRGICKRGSRCKYLHELPERGARGVMSQEGKRAEGSKGRVGLYQRLVEQEKEQEDHMVIEAALHIGEKGFLGNGLQAVNGEGKAS